MYTHEARTTLYSTLEHLWDRIDMSDPVEVSTLQRDIDRAIDGLVDAAKDEGKWANWNRARESRV